MGNKISGAIKKDPRIEDLLNVARADLTMCGYAMVAVNTFENGSQGTVEPVNIIKMMVYKINTPVFKPTGDCTAYEYTTEYADIVITDYGTFRLNSSAVRHDEVPYTLTLPANHGFVAHLRESSGERNVIVRFDGIPYLLPESKYRGLRNHIADVAVKVDLGAVCRDWGR